MEEFVDYYGILELQKDASIEDIEEAIKKTRKRFRRLEGSPDAEQRTNAEKMMQRLNEADELFHDEVRRGKYDASYDANKREVGREPMARAQCREPREETGSQTQKRIMRRANIQMRSIQLAKLFELTRLMGRLGCGARVLPNCLINMTMSFSQHPSCLSWIRTTCMLESYWHLPTT